MDVIERTDTGMLLENPATRQLAGEVADVYRRLESQGGLAESHTLSRALEALRDRGVAGLRDLVRQGLAPAVLLGILGSDQRLRRDVPASRSSQSPGMS